MYFLYRGKCRPLPSGIRKNADFSPRSPCPSEFPQSTVEFLKSSLDCVGRPICDAVFGKGYRSIRTPSQRSWTIVVILLVSDEVSAGLPALWTGISKQSISKHIIDKHNNKSATVLSLP